MTDVQTANLKKTKEDQSFADIQQSVAQAEIPFGVDQAGQEQLVNNLVDSEIQEDAFLLFKLDERLFKFRGEKMP